MEQQNQQDNMTASFETISARFRAEAVSLISEDAIEETEQIEKRRFDNAKLIGLSPNRLVQGNTLRYCKELVRKRQPFFAFYRLLCFVTESSIYSLIGGCLSSAALCVSQKGRRFSGSFDGFYLLLAMVMFCGFRYAKNNIRSSVLSRIQPTGCKEQDFADTLKKKLSFSNIFLIIIFAGAAAMISALNAYRFHVQIPVDVFSLFLGYVGCMLAMGIHNTLYDSHLMPFLAIGGFILTKKQEKEIETAANKYIRLSYVQFLGQARITPGTDADLQKKLQTRCNTQRTYIVFALILLVLIDAVCIWQIVARAGTAALIIFFIAAGLATLLFFTAFLSAAYVLKKLRT